MEAVWLVKSGEKVVGPFSTKEVTDRLRSQEIVIIDEVIAPFSRWRYIRDEPTFGAVVDEIRRGLMNTREDTEIQGFTQSQVTGTGTGTGTDSEATLLLNEDRVSRIAEGSFRIDGANVADAEYEEVVDSGALSRDSSKLNPTRQYAIDSGRPTRARHSNLSIGAWVLAGVFLSGAFYLVVQMNSPNHVEQATAPGDYDKIASDANRAWIRGEFPSSLALYRQANRLRPERPEIVSRLAPLLVQIDGQTVAAKRLVADTLTRSSRSLDAGLMSDLELGQGLASLAADEIKEAEAHFRAALAITPVSFAAGFNLGMSAFLSRSYGEAVKRFSALGDDPSALVMLALSEVEQKAGKRGAMREAESAIARILARHSEYRQEASVIGAYLSLETGNKGVAAGHVRAALDIDPQMTEDHWKDPLLYLQPLSWRHFLQMCQRIDEGLATPFSKALLAQCLAKAGDRERASRTLNDALATSPEDPVLQTLNASFLLASGRDEDARGALRLAMRSETPRLTKIIRARLCERQGDRVCAEEAWSGLIGENPPVLAAYIGLSGIRHQQKQSGPALDLVNRAQAMSPRYLPAIKMRDEVKGL